MSRCNRFFFFAVQSASQARVTHVIWPLVMLQMNQACGVFACEHHLHEAGPADGPVPSVAAHNDQCVSSIAVPEVPVHFLGQSFGKLVELRARTCRVQSVQVLAAMLSGDDFILPAICYIFNLVYWQYIWAVPRQSPLD